MKGTHEIQLEFPFIWELEPNWNLTLQRNDP